MTEIVKYSRIGMQDLNVGTGTFEVTLADGRVVTMDQVRMDTIATGTTASRYPADRYADWINILDFNEGDKTGATNSDDALTRALAFAATLEGGGLVFYPHGVYLHTNPPTIAGDSLGIVGSGMGATQINFEPTAHDRTCFKFSNGASLLSRGVLRDLFIFSSDTTYRKTAIEVSDVTFMSIDSVMVYGDMDHGDGAGFGDTSSSSVALKTKGRDAGSFTRLYFQADIAVQFSINPNATRSQLEDCDHFNYHNCVFIGIASTQSVILIDSYINLSRVSFTGFQAWVGGSGGLKWIDTQTTVDSSGLYLQNVRYENCLDPTAWCINISHNNDLNQLLMDNCYFANSSGSPANGIKLRECNYVTMRNCFELTDTLVALDFDVTCNEVIAENCFWQIGGTTNITGQHLVSHGPRFPSTMPLPNSFHYTKDTNVSAGHRIAVFNSALCGDVSVIANAGTADLGASNMSGLLIVCSSQNQQAIFSINGSSASTVEALDPSSTFSKTQGTASSTNVYWDAGAARYRLENLRGVSLSYRWQLIGGYYTVT